MKNNIYEVRNVQFQKMILIPTQHMDGYWKFQGVGGVGAGGRGYSKT